MIKEDKISIKNYTRWLCDKYDEELTDKDIDNIMFSYGFKYNQEVE